MMNFEIMHQLMGNANDGIITVYGSSGTGKSCLSMMGAVQTVKEGKKVIYMDSDHRFSIDRIKQMSPDFLQILNKIMILQPNTFFQQYQMLQKVLKTEMDSIGLVIVDSIAQLYRLELAKTKNTHEVSKHLGTQIKIIEQISKSFPVIITSHVYDNFKNEKSMISGGDWLRKSSRYLIELRITQNGREAIINNKKVNFEIRDKGIIPL
jgi:DNA repair protein RadB